ncbi:MAG TPA: amidohydrolase family protein [Mycobacteriales bacterium]|nr:amidohydrolase family protein [Mycobacteriales bacterium]
MKAEDLIMVSIDDHIIEPPDVFQNHMPPSLRDKGPQFERLENGIDQWVFQGQVMGTTGLGAVASWPKHEWDAEPVGHAEMRPGCYDMSERIRDMNVNGLLASMNFPTSAGFAGTWLANMPDRALSAAAVTAYNDWQIDELAGGHPGRFIPLALGPLWDRDALVKEIHRVGKKGCTAISFPETPYVNGLPSFFTDHWDPVFKALCDEDIAICLHIGGAFGLMQRPEGATMDQLIVLSPQLSAIATTDLMVSGTFTRFPTLKVALSEGGIGWIPFLLDRVDRHVSNHTWTGLDLGAGDGTDLWRKNFLGCFITDPSALHLVDRIGVDSVAWECDYPHSDSTWPESPEFLLAECDAAKLSDAVINKVTWENACRFFRFDPFKHTPKEQATVRALRALATDVDTSTTSRAEYRARYEAAHVG